jgi:hypothetical protein
MKENQMRQPNKLGHYHRDIASMTVKDRWHVTVTLSCGHVKDMSRASYNRYGLDDATLCGQCSSPDGPPVVVWNIEEHMAWCRKTGCCLRAGLVYPVRLWRGGSMSLGEFFCTSMETVVKAHQPIVYEHQPVLSPEGDAYLVFIDDERWFARRVR